MKTISLAKLLVVRSQSKTTRLTSAAAVFSLLISACSHDDAVATTENKVEPATVATANEPAQETSAAMASNVVIDDKSANNQTSSTSPAMGVSEERSIVTNPTEAGTPEDTVKQALNTLYYGDVKDAVNYYRVDMDNFAQELANTQSAFQQTVESVTITNTQYSVDKIRATITGELKLKGQGEAVPLTYDLQKVGTKWKILG